MKCILCNQRKGKRFCPAKNTLICANCCGSKRIVEIDCPSGCVYLREGQNYQASQKYMRLYRSFDPARQQLMRQVTAQFADVWMLLEKELARAGRTKRGLTDRDALQAVTVLLQNYETENKGVLYDRRADSLDAQLLLDALREILQARRAEIDPSVGRLTLSGAIDCLRLLQHDIEYHLAGDSSGRGYLDFVARSYPGAGRGEKDRASGLIIP